MSRKRRAQDGQSRRRLLIGAAVAGVAAIVATAGWLFTTKTGDTTVASRVELPPPSDSTAPSAPSPSDFVGAERCASCHATQYAAWRGSTHGTAGGPPGTVRVIAPFNGTPIRFRDAV